MRVFLLLLAVAAVSVAGSLPNPAISLVRVPNRGIQPQAIMDRAGTLHLLYYSGDPAHGDLFYVKSPDAGRTWSSPLRVNSQAGAAIALGTIRGGQFAYRQKWPHSRRMERIVELRTKWTSQPRIWKARSADALQSSQ